MNFRRANFDFLWQSDVGFRTRSSSMETCSGTVEGVLGMAVGKMYVERYFPEQSKQRMLQLVKNLQVALGERIQEQKVDGSCHKG